jgi:hypothetical protein
VEYEEPDYDEDFGFEDDFDEGTEPGIVEVYSGADFQSLRDRGLYSEWRCGQ